MVNTKAIAEAYKGINNSELSESENVLIFDNDQSVDKTSQAVSNFFLSNGYSPKIVYNKKTLNKYLENEKLKTAIVNTTSIEKNYNYKDNLFFISLISMMLIVSFGLIAIMCKINEIQLAFKMSFFLVVCLLITYFFFPKNKLSFRLSSCDSILKFIKEKRPDIFLIELKTLIGKHDSNNIGDVTLINRLDTGVIDVSYNRKIVGDNIEINWFDESNFKNYTEALEWIKPTIHKK